MIQEIIITPRDDYIHVAIKGTGNYDKALLLWSSIADACEKNQCYKILGEQNLMDTVSTMEAFDHPALFKKAGITQKHRIAWVDKNPRTHETTAFIGDILTNRSIVNCRIFSDFEVAKTWLLK